MNYRVAIKVDVDTDRGTRVGVPRLARLLQRYPAPACFLFSLGKDNTGRAIRRVLRPGFLSKVGRTGVVSAYGIRTLLNGTLLPGPHIGKRNEALMRSIDQLGFEVGIHCNDHVKWQDNVREMPREWAKREFELARREFIRIFGRAAHTAGAPGWQTSSSGRIAYDAAGLLYSSDSRGTYPYFANIDGHVSSTLEIPTTLPTLDELMGRGFSNDELMDLYVSLLHPDRVNVLTIHAEIEGVSELQFFQDLLERFIASGVSFERLDTLANACLRDRENVPVDSMEMRQIEGRSGTVATQIRSSDEGDRNRNGIVERAVGERRRWLRT